MHLKDICLKLILISCAVIQHNLNSQFGIPHETPRIPNCGIPKIDVFGIPQFGIPSFGIPSFGIPGVNRISRVLNRFYEPKEPVVSVLRKEVLMVKCRYYLWNISVLLNKRDILKLVSKFPCN